MEHSAKMLRRARAKGIRVGRRMLRDGFTRLDVMRLAWKQPPTTLSHAFATGLQDAAEHHYNMEDN